MKKSLLENCRGDKTEPGTARLYHIMQEKAMGADEKSLLENYRGAKSESGSLPYS